MLYGLISPSSAFTKLALAAVMLAWVVIALGVFTRLTDAGLGCPDWPRCYGQLLVPQSETARQKAAEQFPGRVIEPAKAWAEMAHRYVAGVLGVLIFTLAGMAYWGRALAHKRCLTLVLVGLVIAQALLGMWTVTWLLWPLVVVGHLVVGISILGCLWWMALSNAVPSQLMQTTASTNASHRHRMYPWALLGLSLVVLQIALGGWTSANYAALACPDFPYCQGKLLPAMDFARAFHPFNPIGINYEGGVLDNSARLTINTVHRIGAMALAMYVFVLAGLCLRQRRAQPLPTLGVGMIVVLLVQMALGMLNITHWLPLPIALAHNAVAALLLLVMVTLVYQCRGSAITQPKRVDV